MLKLIITHLFRCALLIVIVTGCSSSGGGDDNNNNPSSLSVTLSCHPDDVDYNGQTTLTWSSNKAESCTASGNWTGDKATSGEEVINSLTNDSTFTLTCTDSSGATADASATITVGTEHSGKATLKWTPPTENTDQTPLTDLAGYIIYYGTTPGTYTEEITVEDSTIDTYEVKNLAPATWYFAVAAYNTSGGESQKSNEASKEISE